MPKPMTKYSSVMRQMMAKLTAFERGQFDYMDGRRLCPFTDPLKVEQWHDGWLTEQAAAHRAA